MAKQEGNKDDLSTEGKTKADDGSGSQGITVGDKTYSADDVTNLVAQVSASTKTAQEAKVVLDAAKSYGMEPEQFLSSSMQSLVVINDLIKNGVIDEEGNLVKAKEGDDKGEGKGEGDLDNLFNLNKGGSEGNSGDKQAMDAVSKALAQVNSALGELSTDMGRVKEVQTGMIRGNYQKELQGKFPNLDADDVSKIFGAAANDRTKNIWDLAKTVSEGKAVAVTEYNKKFAEEHGLDYAQLVQKKENKLNEQEADGGVSGLLGEGEKISFRPGKGHVSPAALAEKILAKAAEGT